MLTTDDFLLDDYVFKSSPESCSDHSYSTDCVDVTSDEDFLTQLSSDLAIPLLLNTDDDLGMLNSFFDRSPEEILSEISSPPHTMEEKFAKEIDDLQNVDFSTCGPDAFPNLSEAEMKSEAESSSSADSTTSMSPVHLPSPKYEEYIIKSPPLSPESSSKQSVVLNPASICNLSNGIIYTRPVSVVPARQSSLKKMPPKRIPIVPKTPYPLPVQNNNNNNVVVLNSSVVTNPSTTNVVLLDNTTVPKLSTTSVSSRAVTTINSNMVSQSQLTPVIIDSSKCFSISATSLDPKAFKRQQRKIKNRESASLSRKKKKDYITSLEEQVKDLTVENERLQNENVQLKEKLADYEKNPSNQNKNVNFKSGIYLCVVLLMVGLNLNVMHNPFRAKNQMELIKDRVPIIDHHRRNLLWTEEDKTQSIKNETSKFSPFTMCPATINQTESARLVLELERWIGKPQGNVKQTKNTTLAEKPARLRYRKKKMIKTNSEISSRTYRRQKYHNVDKELNNNPEPRNELQVFSMRPEQAFAEFFEAINRQDDTFYVVSFTDQHLLLPALYHNKTRRPKMSLIMPSLLTNGTESTNTMLPLMQIDCEVLDTRLIHIKHRLVPQHLRTYGNGTAKKEPTHHQTDVNKSNNATKYYKKPYKPYFMDNILKNSRGLFNLH